MKKFRADIHIHTVLSPCADLDMTPKKIIGKAKETGLHIIGITDHNSTKNAWLTKQLAEEEGIYVLAGAEVTTREEVHCLAFFEQKHQLDEFQRFLEQNITRIQNSGGHFGYQPVIDEKEDIVQMVPYYLAAALRKGITDVQNKVYDLNGIFVPAHVNRPMNGLFAQLGFIPSDLKFDALGITGKSTENHVRKHYMIEDKISLLYNSDAHYPDQIGRNFTVFNIEETSFQEIKMAMNQQNNRFVEIR